MNKNGKKLIIGGISTAVVVVFLTILILSRSGFLNNFFKDLKGELIGNSFNISIYDNYGNNILNVHGDKVQVEANKVKVYSVNSSGEWDTTYEMSSVLTNTVDGSNMETVGNTVIYAEEGLEPITDFEMSEDITTSGGTINLVDRNINKIKNMIGTSKVVIISSQLGVPIAVYGGEQVYYDIPDDLPKMTKLNIDGKALYIHRANYIILDTDMIE